MANSNPSPTTRFRKNDPKINRKGRPKKGVSLADKFKDMLDEVLDPSNGYTVLDSIMDAAKTKAMKGDQAALEYVLARAHGKMVDRIETNNTTQEFDFSDMPLEERKKWLEKLKGAGNSDTSTDTV